MKHVLLFSNTSEDIDVEAVHKNSKGVPVISITIKSYESYNRIALGNRLKEDFRATIVSI